MKIINYNEDNIIKQIGEGIEGKVYLYKDGKSEVAFKKFTNDKDILYNSNDNKELKLIILKDEQTLKNDIKILDRVYHMGKFIGYTSVYEPYTPLSYLDSKSNKIAILKLIKDRYEELNKYGIYIGDFNNSNFCLEKNQIKLYDVDNFRIDNLDFNVTNPVMAEYMKKCKNIENIDYFCFNIFAISYLSKIESDLVVSGIGKENYPRFLKTKEVKEFMNYLHNFNDNTPIEKTLDGKPKTLLNVLKQ